MLHRLWLEWVLGVSFALQLPGTNTTFLVYYAGQGLYLVEHSNRNTITRNSSLVGNSSSAFKIASNNLFRLNKQYQHNVGGLRSIGYFRNDSDRRKQPSNKRTQYFWEFFQVSSFEFFWKYAFNRRQSRQERIQVRFDNKNFILKKSFRMV